MPNYQRHIGAFIGPYYRLDHINIGAYQLIIGPNIHWTILWTILDIGSYYTSDHIIRNKQKRPITVLFLLVK